MAFGARDVVWVAPVLVVQRARTIFYTFAVELFTARVALRAVVELRPVALHTIAVAVPAQIAVFFSEKVLCRAVFSAGPVQQE